MQIGRPNVLDEQSFQEAESYSAIGQFSGRTSTWMKALLEVSLILSVFVAGKTTSAMDVHNIRRRMTYTGTIFALIAILLGFRVLRLHEYLERFGWQSDRLTRLANVARLGGLLLFVSGYSRESHTALIVAGSRPEMVEPPVQRVISSELITRLLALESLSSVALLVLPWLNLNRMLFVLQNKLSARAHITCCSSCSRTTITLPQRASPCNDVYCYFCISSEEVPFKCHRCGLVVNSFSSLS